MNDAEKVELYEKFLRGLVKRFGVVVVDPLGPDEDDEDSDSHGDGSGDSNFNDAESRYGGNIDDAYDGGYEYGLALGKNDIADEAANVLNMTGAMDRFDNEETDCG